MDATLDLNSLTARITVVRQQFNVARDAIGKASLELVALERTLERLERGVALATPQPVVAEAQPAEPPKPLSIDQRIDRLFAPHVTRIDTTEPAPVQAAAVVAAKLDAEDDDPPLTGDIIRDEVAPHFTDAYEALCKAAAANPPVKPPEVKPEPEPEPALGKDQAAALEVLLHGDEPVFLTGEAGTGKSWLLGRFMEQYAGRIAAVAPTGVAALRIGAETLHRFFHFPAHALTKDDIKVASPRDEGKYKYLECLVIDEISMVRADMMDAVDAFLRLNGKDKSKPFGGCRLVMVGDLFQLPPVSKEKDEQRYLKDRYGSDTPYFFHAEAWRDNPIKIIELKEVFRQKDPAFTAALNAFRRGVVSPEHMALLNGRVNPTFKPVGDEIWLTLTTRNDAVDAANKRLLATVAGPEQVFDAMSWGFDPKDAPTDEHLILKAGIPIMFVRNDPDHRWVNGSLGKVASVNPLKVEVNGNEHEIEPETWEKIAYEFDEKKKKLSKRTVGEFTQIPVRIAAAITIHRSQGLTLERAIIDFAGGAFAAGQAYVGLSRCKSLEGMILRRPIKESDLIVSSEVQAFMAGKPIARPPQAQPNLFSTASIGA